MKAADFSFGGPMYALQVVSPSLMLMAGVQGRIWYYVTSEWHEMKLPGFENAIWRDIHQIKNGEILVIGDKGKAALFSLYIGMKDLSVDSKYNLRSIWSDGQNT